MTTNTIAIRALRMLRSVPEKLNTVVWHVEIIIDSEEGWSMTLPLKMVESSTPCSCI